MKHRPPCATAALLLGDEPLDTEIPSRRRKARKPKAPRASERSIQIAIRDALRFKGIRSRHVPNEGKRSPVAGRRLKQEGMVPGTLDLIVWPSKGPGRGQSGWMEVKAEDGRLSDAQKREIATLEEDGQRWALVRSIDDALAALREWGWL